MVPSWLGHHDHKARTRQLKGNYRYDVALCKRFGGDARPIGKGLTSKTAAQLSKTCHGPWHLRRSKGADRAAPAPRKKTDCGACGQSQRTFYDRKTRRVRDLSCGDTRVYLEIEIRRVHCRGCGAVKQEKLPWLANNLYYTKRFAFYVGRRCRSATVP